MAIRTIGDQFPDFELTALRGGDLREINAAQPEDYFETVTNQSYSGKWRVIFFYPKDFTFVCPTEIAACGKLNEEFEDSDTQVLGGSTDNEFTKLAWRRDHADLDKLPIWQFADNGGKLARALLEHLGLLPRLTGGASRVPKVVRSNLRGAGDFRVASDVCPCVRGFHGQQRTRHQRQKRTHQPPRVARFHGIVLSTRAQLAAGGAPPAHRPNCAPLEPCRQP